MENKYLGRAIGQEEETEVIMTGESATEAYKKLMEMAENAEDVTTNFERITESPEALAEYLFQIDYNCIVCPPEHRNRCYCYENCDLQREEAKKAWLEWLEKEAE